MIEDMMTPIIALSPEQMTELTLMGMDTSDASMCWVKPKTTGEFELTTRDRGSYLVNHNLLVEYRYAYLLSDIICKLPTYIGGEYGFQLVINPECVAYKDVDGICPPEVEFTGELIECAFEVLKWVWKTLPHNVGKVGRRFPAIRNYETGKNC